MACLMVSTGAQAGKYYQLTKRPMAGGRDPAVELQITDRKVSRRHFVIRLIDDHYLIRELRSRNGVLVNGERIDGEHPLDDQDQIKIGDTELTFFETDDPDRTDAVQEPRQGSRDLREDGTINL